MSIRPVHAPQENFPFQSTEGLGRSKTLSVPGRIPSQVLTESPADMSERVLASLSRIGNEPGVVTVYTEPMGGAVLTDVSVKLTDGGDGTRTIHNHYGAPLTIPPPSSEGVASLGSYEDSARVANDADLYFQGLKINRRI